MIALHVIPVPQGWSVEQAWEAISRGDLLTDPDPAWGIVRARTGAWSASWSWTMPEQRPEARSAATTESRRRWWWFTDERGIRRRPTWWFMLRFRWIAWRENRRDEHPEDETIRAWATYDSGAQDVGRALYVAETMIHLAILEGSDAREAVSKHLNDVRDRFAIPYAKDEASRGA